MDTSKIIIGTVGGGRYTVTAPIVKEDYGLYLKIEGLELPSTYEVDFSNSEHNGTSVTMIGNSDGVLIPHQFIASGKDVFAFLYHVGDNYGRTVFKFRIPNKLRPDRTDEQPTPEEQSVIDQAISALNSAVSATAQDVIDADASAQSASESAEQAQESARTAGLYSDTAQTYANSAEISANSASTSATASAQSAEQSAINSADAQDSAEEAQASASASAQSASASANSASDSQGYAQSASASATSAQGYASSAQTSAQTASNKASEASGYATTASNKATEASGYANTASQKASDASDSASAALGYKTDAESAKTAAQTAQGKAEDAQEAAESAAASVSASASQIAQNTADIADLQTDVAQNEADILKAFPTDTASGAVASFSDGADDIPLKSLIVDINPVQDLSQGDPSPENICPISGWTEVRVEQRGKNLMSPNFSDYTISNNYAFMNDVVKTGQRARFTLVDKDTSVDISGCSIGFHDGVSTNHPVSAYRWAVNNGTIQTNMTNVSSNGTICTGVFIYPKTEETFNKIFSRWYVMIEYGTTATSYEPYTGRSITIQLGQTVYGGKLDVLTGILTVYPEYDSYNGETLTGEWISDRDVYAVGTTPTIGAQVVNIGAQGTEYQLEPHEVKSLLGANNLFADTGDCSVEYRADTKLYIEKLTQPEEDDMVADSAITSGQFFMVGNSLYRALANIASGATITVGTNAQRVSLADALNLVNA